jgi:hypothetical protein
MPRRTVDRSNAQRRKRSVTRTRSTSEEQFLAYLEEASRNEPRALTRYNAGLLFHISFKPGVDVLTERVRALFDAIAPSALAISPGASDRDILYKGLHMWTAIVALAVMDGRPDLERMGIALHAGLVALEERERGFDEPLLRARQWSRNQPRDSFYVRQLKSLSSEAFSRLREYKMKDAASQVAKVINQNRFLPPKWNGKSVTGRSVLNWHARGPFRYEWLFRPEMTYFGKAAELWREDRPEAARKAVLRELSDRLKEMRHLAWISDSDETGHAFQEAGHLFRSEAGRD